METQLLAKLVGGSTLYGLNTPESDVDYRGVFIHENYSYSFGLKSSRKNESDHKVTTEEDYTYYSVRRFLELLRKTNTQALEMLLAPDSAFEVKSPWFQELQLNHDKLVDSEYLFNSLMGYLHNERRLALGERTGRLGGKRKAALDTYGFSYKNVVQYLRLAECGRSYFETGLFPVNMQEHDPEFHKALMTVKLHPELYSMDKLEPLMTKAEEELKSQHDKCQFVAEFDEGYANDFLFRLYKDFYFKV